MYFLYSPSRVPFPRFFTGQRISVPLSLPPSLCIQIKGFSAAKVEKCMAAADKMEQTTFQTAAIELQRREKHVFKIDTGVQELNKMLGGGFDSQAMTELHGEWRTGKTQICHTLCITAQIPKEGTTYGGGRIVYIDTEGKSLLF